MKSGFLRQHLPRGLPSEVRPARSRSSYQHKVILRRLLDTLTIFSMRNWSLVVVAGLLLSRLGVGAVQAQSASAIDKGFFGDWKFNPARSSASPGAPPSEISKSGTRHHEDLGNGFILVQNKRVNANGDNLFSSHVVKLDSKEYPNASKNQTVPATVSFTLVDPYTTIANFYTDGKLTTIGKRTTSKDGNSLTLDETYPNEQGQAYTTHSEFDSFHAPRYEKVGFTDGDAHQAHEAYVTAINSNNLEILLNMLTTDVVFLSPNEPVMVGKAAVRPWLKSYLNAYKVHWDKPVQEFVVSGDWAFERYSYTSTDKSLANGAIVKDTGWGLMVYHHDTDGKWRVARDSWGSDRPLPAK